MEFQKTNLGELSVNGKGSYGIAASAVPYSDELFTYLRITDINDDGTLNKSGLMSVSDEKAEQYLLKPNDIVFARTGGSTGRSYFYDGTDGEFVYAGFLIKFSIDSTKVNPRFIKYYCLSQEYRGWVHSFNTGSTRGNINAQTYANMPILLPSREQQDLLVDTLSVIDEKIKLNTAINENLESQAQALFKKVIINNCNKGNGVLGDYCIIKSGFAFRSSWWTEDGVKVIKIKNIDNGKINLNDCSFVSFDKIEKAKDFLVHAGDVLIAMTGATLGKFAIVPQINEPLLVNQRVGKFFLGDNPIEKLPFLYCTLKQPEVITEIINRGQGSAQANVSGADILSTPCYIPTDDYITEFNVICKSIFESIIINQEENQRFSALRDTLLPKLMNGEIDVSEIKI